MDLMTLIVLIVIVGVLLWAVNTYVPMDAKIKNILNIIVVIALVLFLISLFSGYFPSIQVGHK